MTWLLALALAVGFLLPLQAGVNSSLRVHLGHPLWAALVSFTGGVLAILAVLLLARPPLPTVDAATRAVWWQWLGGVLGALYVTSAIVLAPRIGAAALVLTVLAGQVISSLLLDHYGLIGYPRIPLTPGRAAGAALVVIGVLLVQRR